MVSYHCKKWTRCLPSRYSFRFRGASKVQHGLPAQRSIVRQPTFGMDVFFWILGNLRGPRIPNHPFPSQMQDGNQLLMRQRSAPGANFLETRRSAADFWGGQHRHDIAAKGPTNFLMGMWQVFQIPKFLSNWAAALEKDLKKNIKNTLCNEVASEHQMEISPGTIGILSPFSARLLFLVSKFYSSVIAELLRALFKT